MTERIERVKDALGIGTDRTDAGPDADRHDVERVEGDRAYGDGAYDDRAYDDRTPDAIPDDRLLGRDPEDDPATRHVDPSFTEPAYTEPAYADPVATGDTMATGGTTGAGTPMAAGGASTWPASDSPAESGYADPALSGEAATTPMAAATGTATGTASGGSLSSADDDNRWRDLQARFVDEPEAVTREAGAMVDQAVARLTQALAAAGGDGSTESLRHAFRRYREVYRTLTDA